MVTPSIVHSVRQAFMQLGLYLVTGNDTPNHPIIRASAGTLLETRPETLQHNSTRFSKQVMQGLWDPAYNYVTPAELCATAAR